MNSEPSHAEDKKQQILEAAKDCFIQYGFQKTSLEDIAKRAMISRSSIYHYFSKKEEVFLGLVECIFEESYRAAVEASKLDLPLSEKLYNMFDVWKLEPIKPLLDSPHGTELFEQSHRLFGDHVTAHRRRFERILAPLVGSKEVAEVMTLAMLGLRSDNPNFATFKKRVRTLIDRVAISTAT